MAIREFTFDAFLADQFVQLGHDLYRGDSQWLPPKRQCELQQLSPNCSFLREPGSARQNFLAIVSGKPVGRVSAFLNPQLCDKDGMAVGTLGCFECIQDYSVARDLIDAAVGWLRTSGGRSRIWGPMNYDIWHGYRLMTRGFTEKTFCSEPYNKSYYPEFFERFGFVQRQTWESLELQGHNEMEAMVHRGEARYQRALERGYRFCPFDLKQYERELNCLCELMQRSFGSFLGFTSTSREEFKRVFETNRGPLDPALFLFVRNKQAVPIGFAGSFLDVSDGVRAMRGKESMYARARFIWSRLHSKRIIFYVAGAMAGEARSAAGVGRAVLYHIIQQALVRRYQNIVFALMAKGNTIRGVLSGLAPKAQREYALYELNGGQPSET